MPAEPSAPALVIAPDTYAAAVQVVTAKIKALEAEISAVKPIPSFNHRLPNGNFLFYRKWKTGYGFVVFRDDTSRILGLLTDNANAEARVAVVDDRDRILATATEARNAIIARLLHHLENPHAPDPNPPLQNHSPSDP